MQIDTIQKPPGTQTNTVNLQQESVKSQTREPSDTEKTTPNADTVKLRTTTGMENMPDLQPLGNDTEAILLSQQSGQSLYGRSDGIATQAGGELLRSMSD